MNFVCISPNYPENYWMFCRGLKKYGARVLAIVDTAYGHLNPNLRLYVDEIYIVSSFHNYDEMVRAIGYFTYRYGKIDWIESNNEAWLDLDAHLRDDFNIHTGFSYAEISKLQSKAAMKAYYEKANIPTAPYILPKNVEDALDFAHRVGFPVVLKPDHGVGASHTYKIHNDEDLIQYYRITNTQQMILEKYINGDVFTLDGICDENSNIRFLSSLKYVGNCMESIQSQTSIGSYYDFHLSDEEWDIANRLIHSFGLKNRFFHGEYFKLKEDTEGVGKKGLILGLEMNFRPPGGFAPDLLNYSYDIDVYDLWAEVLLTQKASYSKLQKYSAGFVGRRNTISYKYSDDEIRDLFKDELLDIEQLPPAFARAMGDTVIKARFTNAERRQEFYDKTFEIQEEDS